MLGGFGIVVIVTVLPGLSMGGVWMVLGVLRVVIMSCRVVFLGLSS